MKITVTHLTAYRYDFPVNLEPHIFRLRPRMTNAQQLIAFDLQITPTPAGTTECLDQDGNLALNAWFDAPTAELSDLAVLFCDACRVMGIAARFASGYETASATSDAA